MLLLACESPSSPLEPRTEAQGLSFANEHDGFVQKADVTFGSSLVLLADESGTPRAAFGIGLYSAEDGDFAALGGTPARTLLLPPATRVRLCRSEGDDGVGIDCKEARNTKTVPRLLKLSKSALDQGFATMEVTAFALLFPGLDYAGVPEPLDYGSHEAAKGVFKIVGNDQTRSVFVPPGIRVMMCAHEPQFTPAYCRDYNKSTPNIGYRYVSYALVTPVVTGFDAANALGNTLNVAVAEQVSADALLAVDDKLASLAIPPGLSALLCENGDGSGACETVTRSTLTLPASIAGKVSYLQVKKP